METTTTYPQYRKYVNKKGYFKILSSSEWEEIQVIGSSFRLHQFKVNIMPDRNFLHDLTFDYANHWLVIDEIEYETIKQKAL